MRVKTLCASSLWLVVMCGCGERSLDEMKAPKLLVLAQNTVVDKGLTPLIFLSEGQESSAPDSGDCPELSAGARAFVNDVEVPLESPGGWQSGRFLGPPAHCSSTLFRTETSLGPLPGAQDVTRIRLTEGDTTFTAETQGLCAPRSFRMSAPADGVLHSGQDVELEWHPATDVLLVQKVTLATQGGGTYEMSLARGTLQIEGNRMRFRLPVLGAVSSESARLSLSGDNSTRLYYGGPTRCEGFAECLFECWEPATPWALDVKVQAG